MPKTYKALFEYEVTLEEPEFINEHDEIDAVAIQLSWSECEPDIIATAVSASHGGDLFGFIEWGTDDEGKWAVTDMDGATTDVTTTYGTVQYKVEEISWNYEGPNDAKVD